MEDIRYAVIHAESGAYQVAFDKREAELRSAARLQFLVRYYHKRGLHYMEAASEWGDEWPIDRDEQLEIARIHQRIRAVYARRAMELMGVIDQD